MKLIKFITLLFTVTVLLAACESENSSDVNQSRIYTVFNYYYSETTDVTHATARFRFGNKTGTLLELSDGSTIEVNGNILNYNSAFVQYDIQFAGYVPEGNFVWTDADGKLYSNSITLKEIATPEITTISRESSYDFEWVGNALQEDEYVTLFVEDSSEDAASIFTQNNIGSTSIIIPLNELQELLPGDASLELELGFEQDFSESTEAVISPVNIKLKQLLLFWND